MQNTEKPRSKDNDTCCPLWQKPLSKVCHKCEWYINLKGKDPQGEMTLDHWGCAIRWLPILQIETTQQARQAGASSDKVANEIKDFHESMNTANAVAARLFLAAAEREQSVNKISGPRDITPDRGK